VPNLIWNVRLLYCLKTTFRVCWQNSNAFFTFDFPFYVIFYEWYVSTEMELVISCIRVVFMAVCYQGFKVLLDYLRLREVSNMETLFLLASTIAAIHLNQWFSTFLGPWTIFLNKISDGPFAMLTPHEQLVKTVLYIGRWTQRHFQSRIYGTFFGPLEISPVVHQDHTENHWPKWTTCGPPGPRWESLT